MEKEGGGNIKFKKKSEQWTYEMKMDDVDINYKLDIISLATKMLGANFQISEKEVKNFEVLHLHLTASFTKANSNLTQVQNEM